MELKILILNFLVAIQGVESNHGRYLAHIPIENPKSIHYGDKAIGNFAMMPNTIKLLGADVERFKTDKHYSLKVSKKYALQILQAARGCPLKASILWLKGPAAKITLADYQTIRYNRFVKEWETFFGPIHKDRMIMRYCEQI